jgi:hypothetical protein
MRKSVCVVFLALAALAVLPGILSAQKPESQMFLIVDCTVKPSMETKFWDTAKEEVAFYGKNGYPYAWKVYAAEGGHYYIVYPIKGLADIDEVMKASRVIMAKDAAGYQALSAKYTGTYESYKVMTFTFRPELSMIPENPYYAPAETNFICLDIWSGEPEKEAEFESILKEMMALTKKKGVRDTWYCLAGGLGTDQPVYVMASPDKDETEFIKHNADMWKLLGDEITPLYQKGLSLCRKRETRRLWYQAELSYTPAKK